MSKIYAKIIINFYGVMFILFGAAAIFINPKMLAEAIVFIFTGVLFLRRKTQGVYIAFFILFVVGGVGLVIAGLAAYDILRWNYKIDLLLIGLVPVILFVLTSYLFTRREVAEEFGLSKIAILEKVNKKELIVAVKFLFWMVFIVGVVLLACYLVAMSVK